MYVCVYVCIYTHIYIHTYMHTYIGRPAWLDNGDSNSEEGMLVEALMDSHVVECDSENEGNVLTQENMENVIKNEVIRKMHVHIQKHV